MPAHALLGDVNGDGVVNLLDAQVLSNYLIGAGPLPYPQNADVNGDGRINTADALLILQVAEGLRTNFASQIPQVLAVLPSSGSVNALLSANVSVFFSAPISSASLTGTMTLSDLTAGQPVSGTISASANGVIETFFPSQALSPSHTYQVSVTTMVTNGFGQNLTQAFASTFQTTSTGTLTLVSVNNSTAAIGAIVPILVQTLSTSSTPVTQIPVTFQVVSGNGVFQPSGLQTQTVISNATGYAQVSYQTSTQVNQDSVTISAAGFSSTSPFIVTTVLNPPANLRIYSGTNQIGASSQTVAMPLIVQVTDSGGNNVAGTTVTFSVTQGSGTFSGSSIGTAVTDSSGTAAISFTLGPSSGTVLVSAMFPSMVGQPPIFNLQDLIPQVSSPTTVVGHVVDAQTLQPLENVYVYLVDNPSIWDWTDASGFFTLTVSSGSHVLEVDGYQSGPIGGQLYPVVSVPVNAVLGQTNDTGVSLLPELEQTSYIDVSDVQGGTLTLTSNPLWQLYVAPGQVTFSSGTHTGRLYAASVPPDRIPMPVAGGKNSRFFDTIQPLNVTFNPPAQVSFPNMDNIPPGTITDIFTLSYSSGMFVKTGRGQVSQDGTIIQSLPGEGITSGGWHNSPDPVQQALCCLSGILNLGPESLTPTITVFGLSTLGIPVGVGEWAFDLCNIPTDQGPFTPVASAANNSAPAPLVSPPGFQDTPNSGPYPQNSGSSTVNLSIGANSIPLSSSTVMFVSLDPPAPDTSGTIMINSPGVAATMGFTQSQVGFSMPNNNLAAISLEGIGVGQTTITVTAAGGSNSVALSVVPSVQFLGTSGMDGVGGDAFDRINVQMGVNLSSSQQTIATINPSPTTGVSFNTNNPGVVDISYSMPVTSPETVVTSGTSLGAAVVFSNLAPIKKYVNVQVFPQIVTAKISVHIMSDTSSHTTNISIPVAQEAVDRAIATWLSQANVVLNEVIVDTRQVTGDFGDPVSVSTSIITTSYKVIAGAGDSSSITNLNIFLVPNLVNFLFPESVTMPVFGYTGYPLSDVPGATPNSLIAINSPSVSEAIAHEIGHYLGLQPPLLDYDDLSRAYELMSHGTGLGFTITPMQVQYIDIHYRP